MSILRGEHSTIMGCTTLWVNGDFHRGVTAENAYARNICDAGTGWQQQPALEQA